MVLSISFILYTFINKNTSVKKTCPLTSIYLFYHLLCQYEKKDIYFIILVVIQIILTVFFYCHLNHLFFNLF